MHIQGSIEGNPIAFYYNLDSPNATLQCDDHLHIDPISKNHKSMRTRNRKQDRSQHPNAMCRRPDLKSPKSLPQKNASTYLTIFESWRLFQKLNTQIGDILQSSFWWASDHITSFTRHTEKSDHSDLAFLTHSRRNYAATNDMKTAQRTPHNQKPFQTHWSFYWKFHKLRTPNLRRQLKKREALLQKSSKKSDKSKILYFVAVWNNVQTQKQKKLFFKREILLYYKCLTSFTRQDLSSCETNTDDPNYILNINDFSRFVDYLDKPDKMITENKQLTNFSAAFQKKYEQQQKKADSDAHDSLTSLEAQMEASFELAFG